MKGTHKWNDSLISVYLLVMFGIFPIYYRQRYSGMGEKKYQFFLYPTACMAILFVLLCLLGLILWFCAKSKKQAGKSIAIPVQKPGPMDIAMITYLCTVVISFLLTDFKDTGFWGTKGWSMGLLSQLLFVVVYFALSRGWDYEKWALLLLCISSSIVFIIAILHRFDVDIFGIYGDLSEQYKVLFLSTMGQSSWYSSFLCTVYPIGLYVFYTEKDWKKRRWAAAFSAIAMMSLVTQNTDSAFFSLFVVMIVFFYLSFEGQVKEFLEVIILILASFCFMGICQKLFADRVIPLDSLSLFMSQNVLIWGCFVSVTGVYLWIYRKVLFPDKENAKGKKKKAYSPKTYPKTLFWVVLTAILTSALLILVFIIINTNGWLVEKTGYQSTNNYLLFDEQWGNGRGFAWKFVAATFGDLSFGRKLFGVGPDCFSAFTASVPKYSEQMKAFWDDLTLTNAHNEYLTKLYTLGLVGLASYVVMLVTGFASFMKNRDKNPLLPAFAACIASYMVHNIFCYEQVCCTPIFYILMGIGSNLIYNSGKKKTY